MWMIGYFWWSIVLIYKLSLIAQWLHSLYMIVWSFIFISSFSLIIGSSRGVIWWENPSLNHSFQWDIFGPSCSFTSFSCSHILLIIWVLMNVSYIWSFSSGRQRCRVSIVFFLLKNYLFFYLIHLAMDIALMNVLN